MNFFSTRNCVARDITPRRGGGLAGWRVGGLEGCTDVHMAAIGLTGFTIAL